MKCDTLFKWGKAAAFRLVHAAAALSAGQQAARAIQVKASTLNNPRLGLVRRYHVQCWVHTPKNVSCLTVTDMLLRSNWGCIGCKAAMWYQPLRMLQPERYMIINEAFPA